MAKTRLKNWPKGIKAGQLQWIGSPQRVGEERQWVSKLAFSFLSTDGQPRDSTFIVKAPWGMLPALRVGNIYREGVPGKRNRDERTVTAVVDTGLEVIAAREVPSSICKASTSFRASESCLRFQASSFQYYLPCCEIIRTLLGPNTWLANALMDPELLNEMIYGETHHGNASLVMSNVLPTSFAQAPLLQQLALLRLDAEWNNAFRQVFHDRQSIGVRTGRME
ncbi:MAG: hypothetical protein NTX35_17115, partial [Verrucomicrobia bacterium]|nr:hypothetical protein [Verrucomicrobiota bacterium]